VFLPGFRVDARWDGDGLPGAAGLGVRRGLQDLRAVAVQGHGRGAQGAAEDWSAPASLEGETSGKDVRHGIWDEAPAGAAGKGRADGV
jgi:hypothetical protein